MLFHTFKFAVFFAIFFAIYWSIRPHRWRMLWLLAGSIYFYMSCIPWQIILILFTAGIDYVVALQMDRSWPQVWKRRLVTLSICVNLGLLAFFKYSNFFLDNLDAMLQGMGLSVAGLRLDLILPLGISFYTFETICYIVDVYQGKVKAVRSWLDYALYIMFFPHLIAGPIVRSHEFLPQLRRTKRFSWERMLVGTQLFIVGFFKKAIIADQLGILVVDPVFANPDQFASLSIWLAVFGYAMQIYCDFSGYTDMARGLAQMLGFHLPLNFNLPYLAKNVTEFWQRWHISLSSWLRDYLYIPLGGNRGAKWKTYRNLMLTMALGGFWHGAQWTFVVWGIYHGSLLAIHRMFRWPDWLGTRAGRIVSTAATFVLICIGWVFFRAESLSAAFHILQRMLLPTTGMELLPLIQWIGWGIVLGLLLGHLLVHWSDPARWRRWMPPALMGMGLASIFLLGLLFFPEGERAFIYFQF